VKGFPQ